MKSVARDQLLQAMAAANVWANDDAFAAAVGVQQQQLDRIAEIIMVELVIADALLRERDPFTACLLTIEPSAGLSPEQFVAWSPPRCSL